MACLVASNALEADSLKALPLGHIARQIHGENELWLAIVLTHPAVQVTALLQCAWCMLKCTLQVNKVTRSHLVVLEATLTGPKDKSSSLGLLGGGSTLTVEG